MDSLPQVYSIAEQISGPLVQRVSRSVFCVKVGGGPRVCHLLVAMAEEEEDWSS